MFFKFNTLTLASLSMLLAACGGSSDSNNTISNSNASAFFSTDWFYVSLYSYNSHNTTDNTGTIYTYDIRSEAYNYDKTSNLISYSIETIVGPTSYHDQKSYIATATQLLTIPATLNTTGIPDSFLINESDNSITVAPYNQEGIKTAALTKITFKKVDLSNTLISDLIKKDISFFTLLSVDTNPHYLKAQAAGIKFPTGSILLEQTKSETFEDSIWFDSLSSFNSIVSYKTGTSLPVGASFSDNLWANGKVKSSCIVTTTGSRQNCVAEHEGKLYSAYYTSKEVVTDADNLETYWHINKTAADALGKAYKDNFKSETIAKTTNEAAAK